jgi:hypothetical protein
MVMALVVSAPLQLAAAAGVEVSGGYDSTVLNALTFNFGDGGILRTALDLQVGHRTDTLRQTLRARGEFYFAGGEGRSIDYANLNSLNRYSLQWDPNDDWRFAVDAGYNIGQSPLMFQGVGDPTASFRRGIFGEYNALGRLTRTFIDRYRVSLYGGVNGRHTVEVPEGTPRGDMIVYRLGVDGSADIGERDTVGLAFVGQRLGMAGLGDWVDRVTAFGTWRHAWTDSFNSGVSLGADFMQDQTDPTRQAWNSGPYANLTATKVFVEQRLAFTVAGRYEFQAVNTVRCGGALRPDGLCPPELVIAGGAGRVGGGTFQFAWRPREDGNLTITGIATADYGLTRNVVLATVTTATGTREVANMNVTAVLNARWAFSRHLSAFARYTFLFQHVEEPQWFPDIRRHVILAGVTVSLTAGEADYLDGVIPFTEAEVTGAIRNAVSSAPGAAEVAAEQSASGEENGVLEDPLDPGDRPAPPPLRRPGDPEEEPTPGAPARPTTAPTGATPGGSNAPPSTPPRDRPEGSKG